MSANPNIKADTVETITASQAIYGTAVGVSAYNQQGTIGIIVRTSDLTLTTPTAVNAYLSQHPIKLVYEKATSTTEYTSPFEANQIVDANGTEEYIDAGVEAGTRDVAIPVGHETKYYHGKAYVKPLTAGTSDTVSMADMGIMPTSPMYIEANGTLDVEYWKSNS